MKSTVATVLFLIFIVIAGDQASRVFTTPLPPEGAVAVPASALTLSSFLPIFDTFQVGHNGFTQPESSELDKAPSYQDCSNSCPIINIPL